MRTCCLVAASDFNESDFIAHWRAGLFADVVAVDAGWDYLRSCGCTPDFALGDFDSLGFVPEGEHVAVYPAHKDKSDMELALDFALEQGYDAVRAYGVLGGRLDHTVANLQLCAHFAESGLEMTLVDRDSAVRILVGPGKFDLPELREGTVSVFSAVDESIGVSERGMEYPLENAVLSNRTSLGLSNELLGQPASVELQSGTLYVFYPL